MSTTSEPTTQIDVDSKENNASGAIGSNETSQEDVPNKKQKSKTKAKPKRKRKTKRREDSWRSSKQRKAAASTTSSETGQPRRKSTRTRKRTTTSTYDYCADLAVPSSSFYLGMVEDGETVEMIEKKFAALAELEAKKKAKLKEQGIAESDLSQNGLSVEEQEQLFKETSTFTVSNVQRDVEDVSGMLGEEDFGWQLPSFDIDADDDNIETIRDMMDLDDDFWDDMYSERKAAGRRRKTGGVRKRTTKQKRAPAKSYICDRRGHFVTALKRVTHRGANHITYHRIPPRPLPLSWGRVIAPFVSSPKPFSNCYLMPTLSFLYSCQVFTSESRQYVSSRVSVLPKNATNVDDVT